ncbi:MAG: DNA translocase FtsK [Candidatus Omnitrophota bacterium]
MSRDKIDLIKGIGLFALMLFLLAAMFSYSPYDIKFETSTPNLHIRNYAGITGAYISWSLFRMVGYSGFFIPFLFLIWGIGILAERLKQGYVIRFLGLVLFFSSISTFFCLSAMGDSVAMVERGGLVGYFFSNLLLGYFGRIGSFIITGALSVLALLVITEFLVIPLISFLFLRIWNLIRELKLRRAERAMLKKVSPRRERPRLKPAIRVQRKLPKVKDEKEDEEEEEEEEEDEIAPRSLPKISLPKPKPPKKSIKIEPRIVGDYKMPPLDLLSVGDIKTVNILEEDLETSSRILEDTLRDFNIEVKVVNVSKGPVITRYELQPAPGVKVHRITSLSDDIALTMKATTVRIVAPIPGKSAVGIEVPNQSSSLVYLREVLESSEFQKKAKTSKLTMALGKDISGRSVVAELGDMPHLLIAGTTGSGKTVCVNSIIMSMIYNATPDELKFIMVDPKMVELAIYNGLPHLLCPVVTDSKKASGALLWVVNEMEDRYKKLAKVAARNIDAFNKKVETQDEKLPFIVVIIDELADLMMIAQHEVENTITRLAQLSRAVGIHIILATQRPSVDVVTGVIKANFPARISFKVASKVDSRTVLDMNGADKLLGKGDMLFLQPGNAKPIRAQGTLLSDNEIEKVVGFIKEQREPFYDDEILEQQKKSLSSRGGFDKDEFFDEAVQMVLETGQASVSMIQRRLRLGYTRAARLIDSMEEEGIVGSYRGSKPREILIKEYKPKEEIEAGEA